MAFVADDPSANPTTADPNKQSNPGAPPTLGSGGSGGLFGSGPPGGGASAGAAGGAAAAPPKSDSSGSWTNLNSYLNSNQDQAAPMANAVTGSVSNEAAGAQNSLNSDVQGYTDAVDAATTKEDPNLFNAVATDPTSLTAAQQQQFSGDVGAAYTAPTAFAPSSTTENDYNTAAEDVTNAGFGAGQAALLQKQYGSDPTGYNQGEANLDQMILGGSADSQNAFKDLNSNWSGIGNDLTNAATAAQNYNTAAQATTAQTATDAQNVLGTDATNLAAQVAADPAAAQLQGSQQMTALDNALSQGYIPTQYGTQLQGLVGQDLYGVSPTQFVTANPVAATAQNTETAQQAAEYSALNSLADGAQIAALNGTTGVDSTVGAYNPANAWNPFTVDTSAGGAGMQAVQQAKTNLTGELGTLATTGGDSVIKSVTEKQAAAANQALLGGGDVYAAYKAAAALGMDPNVIDPEVQTILNSFGFTPGGSSSGLQVSDNAPAATTPVQSVGAGVVAPAGGAVSTDTTGTQGAVYDPNAPAAPAPTTPFVPTQGGTSIQLPQIMAGVGKKTNT